LLPTPYGLSANQGQGDGEFGKAIRNWPTPLQGMARKGMLMFPTPNQWDGQRGGESRETKQARGSGGVNLVQAVGGTLNPQFVSWMMGFPLDWCDMPEESQPESLTESTSSDASATP